VRSAAEITISRSGKNKRKYGKCRTVIRVARLQVLLGRAAPVSVQSLAAQEAHYLAPQKPVFPKKTAAPALQIWALPFHSRSAGLNTQLAPLYARHPGESPNLETF
jgi:hypothetical protein